jgi:hypothetical protein
MPTAIPQKRTWCKTCNDFQIHKTTITGETDKFSKVNCTVCDSEYVPYSLSEVPDDKLVEQRKRYKAKRSSDFRKMMGMYMEMSRSNGPMGSYEGNEAQEDDAGQEDIDKLQREANELKRQEELEFKSIYKGLNRNDKCRCGSGLKYKKCCLPKVEKIR